MKEKVLSENKIYVRRTQKEVEKLENKVEEFSWKAGQKGKERTCEKR